MNPEQPTENSVPLSHYLWVMRRYRWHMLSFVAICTIATFIISTRMPPIFESTATLDVDRNETGSWSPAAGLVLGTVHKPSPPEQESREIGIGVRVPPPPAGPGRDGLAWVRLYAGFRRERGGGYRLCSSTST